MNVVAIIQARTGSTRLPGKVLMELAGKSLLWHVIQRVKFSRMVNKIVLATTNKEEDDILLKLALDLNIDGYAGSEEDVLDRYYRSAKLYRADPIVRITADDPFKDPAVMDKLINTYLNNKDKYDYVSNTIEPTYPEGIDVEVFSFSALERAWRESKNQIDREHVTTYIWRYPSKFRLFNVINEQGNLSNHRWTIDTEEDYNFAKEVYDKLYKQGRCFSMGNILKLLKTYPQIQRINSSVEGRQICKQIKRRGGRIK